MVCRWCNKMFFEEIEINDKVFVKVCKSNELINKKGKLFKFDEDDDMQVALFRIHDKLYCVSNICPHRHAEEIYNGLLSQIECDGDEQPENQTWAPSKDVVTCPLHGWSYFLENGYNVNQKQGIKRITTYSIFEENGYVFIEKPKLSIPKWRANL